MVLIDVSPGCFKVAKKATKNLSPTQVEKQALRLQRMNMKRRAKFILTTAHKNVDNLASIMKKEHENIKDARRVKKNLRRQLYRRIINLSTNEHMARVRKYDAAHRATIRGVDAEVREWEAIEIAKRAAPLRIPPNIIIAIDENGVARNLV